MISRPTPAPVRWPIVLFDFDGTLADTIALIVASYQHAIDTIVGEYVSDDTVRDWIGRPMPQVFTELYPCHSMALTTAYRRWNLAHHDEMIRPIDGVGQLLADLHTAGIRTGVVSSKKAASVRLGMSAVGLAYRIDVLCGQDDTTAHKPDPMPLQYAVEQLDAPPTAVVYVGDATVDVEAAQAAGMAAVAVTWGAGTADALAATEPTALVHDVAALRDVLLSGDTLPAGNNR